MKYLVFLLVPWLCLDQVLAQLNITEKLHNSKYGQKGFARGIFNVIQFPNTGCPGGSGRNGTCYTSSECLSKGGSSDGSCANGYGVCCIIKIGCGQSTRDNNSYFVLGPTTSPPSSCIFTICESSSDICRIRLDFNSFDINGPVVGTIAATSQVSGVFGNAVGDCTTDSFTFTTPNNDGSPVICGFNTNQHMYMDSSSACSIGSLDFAQYVSATRSVDIKITQYTCGDEQGGPDDCLQYFTSETGVVSSFNFRTSNTGVVTSSATHLSSQSYDMCFRRAAGKCALCLTPAVTGGSLTMQTSFGLSIPDATTGGTGSRIDSACSTDYLIIPGGVSGALATANDGVTTKGKDRFCGRYLNVDNKLTTSATVCTARRPFRITFRTDADEMSIASAGAEAADELAGFPGGIVGFSLAFSQLNC